MGINEATDKYLSKNKFMAIKSHYRPMQTYFFSFAIGPL